MIKKLTQIRSILQSFASTNAAYTDAAIAVKLLEEIIKKLKEANNMELNYFYAQQPDCESRFVAILSDNSGANLFRRDGEGCYFDSEGGDIPNTEWFEDAGYSAFMYLPDDDFLLFYEQ